MDGHLWFIHLSIDGHLGCFYFLAVGDAAAVNKNLFKHVFQIAFCKPSVQAPLSRAGPLSGVFWAWIPDSSILETPQVVAMCSQV